MILGEPYDFHSDILWFVSSPVRPIKGETQIGNAQKAAKLIRLLESNGLCVTAPYLGTILADVNNERSEEEVFKAMEIDKQILARCDGIILIGDRISEGMRAEMLLAMAMKKPVWNMVGLEGDDFAVSADQLISFEDDFVFGANNLDPDED